MELRRIANALEYFAIRDARANNQMFIPATTKRKVFSGDESELFHTDDLAIALARQEEYARFLQQGYPAIEAEEAIEE